jgi:hypothetical protein
MSLPSFLHLGLLPAPVDVAPINRTRSPELEFVLDAIFTKLWADFV